MSAHMQGALRLTVLNPGGRDKEQDFATPALATSDLHAPVNYHAYAACTGGAFHRDVDAAIAAGRPVLLLLRGDFRAGARAFRALRKASIPVAISLKETGLHQIAEQLQDQSRLRRFMEIVAEADGCIAPTPEAADIYRDMRRGEGVSFIPTPYPLHDPEWDFSGPVEHRHGILVGTREWDVLSRNHAAALFAARRLSDTTGCRVTVYNFDGRKGERMLKQIGFRPNRLRIMPRGDRDYTGYLRVVAEHKLVLQMDTSFVPGQVAGDALLCRMPCVGGNGAIDRLAHSATCGAGRFGAELLQIATRLLVDAEFYGNTVAESQKNAAERLAFKGVAHELQQFFAHLPQRSGS